MANSPDPFCQRLQTALVDPIPLRSEELRLCTLAWEEYAEFKQDIDRQRLRGWFVLRPSRGGRIIIPAEETLDGVRIDRSYEGGRWTVVNPLPDLLPSGVDKFLRTISFLPFHPQGQSIWRVASEGNYSLWTSGVGNFLRVLLRADDDTSTLVWLSAFHHEVGPEVVPQQEQP